MCETVDKDGDKFFGVSLFLGVPRMRSTLLKPPMLEGTGKY
jgi:hypothetical protein